MNKVIKKQIYRILLDVDTVINIGEVITATINDIIPKEKFPKIEISHQGVKKGTRFVSPQQLGQGIARQIAIYLREHVILDQKEILEEE